MCRQEEQEFIKIIDESTGIINSLCRVYNKTQEDFQDARQDVILQCWKSFHSFKQRSHIKTWIYKVTLQTLLNRQRRKRNLATINIDEAINLSIKTTGLYCDDDLALLQQLLNTLSDENKAIMTLYLEGYKYKEIGDIIDISASKVSTNINRIKKKFSTLVKKNNYEF